MADSEVAGGDIVRVSVSIWARKRFMRDRIGDIVIRSGIPYSIGAM